MTCWNDLQCCETCECECFPEPPDVTIPGWTAAGDWGNAGGCCCWSRVYTKNTPSSRTCFANIQTLSYTSTREYDVWALKLPQPPIYTSPGIFTPPCPIPVDRCCIPTPPFEKVLQCDTTANNEWRVDFYVDWEWNQLILYYGRVKLSCDGNPAVCKYFLAYTTSVAHTSVVYAEHINDETATGSINACFEQSGFTASNTCGCTPTDCDDTPPPPEESCLTTRVLSTSGGTTVFSRVNLYDAPLTTGSYSITGTPDCEYIDCLVNIDVGFISEVCVGTGSLCIALIEPDINSDVTTVTVNGGPCGNTYSYNNCDPEEGCIVAARICTPATTCSDQTQDFQNDTTIADENNVPDDGCYYLWMQAPNCACSTSGTYNVTPKYACDPLTSLASCNASCCWIFDCKYPQCYSCYPKYATNSAYVDNIIDFNTINNSTFTPAEACMTVPTITAVFP